MSDRIKTLASLVAGRKFAAENFESPKLRCLIDHQRKTRDDCPDYEEHPAYPDRERRENIASLVAARYVQASKWSIYLGDPIAFYLMKIGALTFGSGVPTPHKMEGMYFNEKLLEPVFDGIDRIQGRLWEDGSFRTDIIDADVDRGEIPGTGEYVIERPGGPRMDEHTHYTKSPEEKIFSIRGTLKFSLDLDTRSILKFLLDQTKRSNGKLLVDARAANQALANISRMKDDVEVNIPESRLREELVEALYGEYSDLGDEPVKMEFDWDAIEVDDKAIKLSYNFEAKF